MNTKPIVVVPWDFSLYSQTALDYAIKKHGCSELRVICVLERPNAYEMGWGGEEAEQKAIDSCVGKFSETTENLRDTGLEFSTIFGDPSDEIVRFATQHAAESIVMSTHGRTGLKKLFMGSVAQKVIAKASCPVIVLPARWSETDKS